MQISGIIIGIACVIDFYTKQLKLILHYRIEIGRHDLMTYMKSCCDNQLKDDMQ